MFIEDIEYNFDKFSKSKKMGKSSSRYSVKGNGMIAKFINRNSEVQNEDEVKDEVIFSSIFNSLK